MVYSRTLMGDDVFERPSYSYSYDSSHGKKGKSSMIRMIAIILIVLGLGAFAVNAFFNSNSVPVEEEIALTPTPTDFIFPTDTPTPTPPPSTPSATPKLSPVVSPIDKATGLSRSSLKVDVQNGSGQVGVASKMAEVLKSFGYTVGQIGNASSYDYLDVSILVKSTKSAYIPLLKKDLETTYTVASTSATLSASSSADAVVIIGK